MVKVNSITISKFEALNPPLKVIRNSFRGIATRIVKGHSYTSQKAKKRSTKNNTGSDAQYPLTINWKVIGFRILKLGLAKQ